MLENYVVYGTSLRNCKIEGDKPVEKLSFEDISHYSSNPLVGVVNVVMKGGKTLLFQFENRGTLIQFVRFLNDIVN